MKFEDIHSVGMIGSGTMGAGMSWCFALAGYQVKLYDLNPEQLEKARARIKAIHKLFVEEGLASEDEAQAASERIQTVTHQEESLEGAQYVLEAVTENLALKQKLFAQFEACCPLGAILATNTSGLRITEIASVCQHPERVAGMHWANPPEIVPLVEVIRGEQTSDETVDIIYKVTEKLGKLPVVVNKDIPGFVSNRLQYAVLREALHLVDAGIVSVEDVDRTLKGGVGFRYPWLGPLETVDLGGVDVFYGISLYLLKELSNMSSPPEFFGKLMQEGKLGIKSGQGFYDYSGASRDEVLRKRDLYFVRQLKLIREVQASQE
jgi:3-hydroxybutyryl-CoA dehydrogenase